MRKQYPALLTGLWKPGLPLETKYGLPEEQLHRINWTLVLRFFALCDFDGYDNIVFERQPTFLSLCGIQRVGVAGTQIICVVMEAGPIITVLPEVILQQMK